MASVVRPPRPAIVTVLAVLHLLVGAVGAVAEGTWLCYAVRVYTMSNDTFTKAAVTDAPLEVQRSTPFFQEANLAASAVGLALSLALIAAGVGLLRVRRWALNLSVLYGGLSLAYQVVWMAYFYVMVAYVILPAFENPPAPAGFYIFSIYIGTPQAYRDYLHWLTLAAQIATPLGLIYPLFVLIVTSLPSVKKAFRRPKPEEALVNIELDQPAPAAAPGASTGVVPSAPPEDRVRPEG
jgi:hypothetical protein